jgi:hypothetical protein
MFALPKMQAVSIDVKYLHTQSIVDSMTRLAGRMAHSVIQTSPTCQYIHYLPMDRP